MKTPLAALLILLSFTAFCGDENKVLSYMGKSFQQFKVSELLGENPEGVDAYHWKSKSFEGIQLKFGPTKEEREAANKSGDLRYLAQIKMELKHIDKAVFAGNMPFGLIPDLPYKKMLKMLEKRTDISELRETFSKHGFRKEIRFVYPSMSPFKGKNGIEVVLKTHSNEKNPIVLEVEFQEPGFK